MRPVRRFVTAFVAAWMAVAAVAHGDHGDLSAVLAAHVDSEGWVDYGALAEDPAALDRYIEWLSGVVLEDLELDEELALLINAYNAFTLRLILDYWDNGALASIRDIPEARRWKDRRWRVGQNTWSLDELEHQQIRPKFDEPRVHFALVCAAVSCPPLRAEAYEAGRLEEQLEEQSRDVHEHGSWFRFDSEARAVHLTPLYDWFAADFEAVAESVLDFAARYSPDLARALETGTPTIHWLDYDWALNSSQIGADRER